MPPPSLSQRLSDALSETRLVMLGAQIMLGMQYRVAFLDAFDTLRPTFAALDGVALLLILCGVAPLLAIPALHHLGAGGHASGAVLARATYWLGAAMLPLACTIGIDIAIAFAAIIGIPTAIACGSGFFAAAVAAWYLLPMLAADPAKEASMGDSEESVETRLQQGLTELRVILPGAQALFGFQFSAVLTQAFERLPQSSKAVHAGSMLAVAVTIILLLAPAAFHRIAAKGNAEPRVLTYTTSTMLCAAGLLAVGFAGDAYVTMGKIFDMPLLSLAVSLAVLLGFIVMLYVVPLDQRRGRRIDGTTTH